MSTEDDCNGETGSDSLWTEEDARADTHFSTVENYCVEICVEGAFELDVCLYV